MIFGRRNKNRKNLHNVSDGFIYLGRSDEEAIADLEREEEGNKTRRTEEGREKRGEGKKGRRRREEL